MTRKLDLADIQGNILCDYGSSFPKGRYLFLNIPNAAAGRAFVDAVRGKVTTSISWDDTEGYPSEQMTTKPKVAINIAFTFAGLLAIDLPTATLAGMPSEFIDGMAARAQQCRSASMDSYTAVPRVDRTECAELFRRLWKHAF